LGLIYIWILFGFGFNFSFCFGHMLGLGLSMVNDDANLIGRKGVSMAAYWIHVACLRRHARPPQDINPAGIPAFDPQRAPQAILLTGATGFLGMVTVTLYMSPGLLHQKARQQTLLLCGFFPV
jgi:hypothetical protein